MAGGAEYSVSGKLIDSASKKPIAGKEISVTTDGDSPKGTDTTNSKGEFEVNLKAPEALENMISRQSLMETHSTNHLTHQ